MYRKDRCIQCDATLKPSANFCTRCGTEVIEAEENFCVNPNCTAHKTNVRYGDEDLYCSVCGKETTLGRKVNQYT